MLIRDRIPRPREASTEAAKDSVRFAKDPGHRELWHELSDGLAAMPTCLPAPRNGATHRTILSTAENDSVSGPSLWEVGGRP